MSPLSAALVIARRDYVASVWSRTFLFFLIGPLLPLLAGGMFAAIGSGADRAAPRAVRVLVVAAPGEIERIGHAHAALARGLGRALHRFDYAGVRTKPDVRTAVLAGGLDAPRLEGPPDTIAAVRRDVALVLDRARADRALAAAGAAPPAPVAIAERPVEAPPAPERTEGGRLIARLGQVVLMFLTVMLTGMMLSNMVEEKSNKVIEVLTAAVPVDGIFFGKLTAMLGLSLTGIAVWGTMAAGAFLSLPGGAATLPEPAVGWPAFLSLGVAYFCATYLLLGAVFLGIGAQAASVREVQTMSMPLTMAQLGVVAFASSAVGDLNGRLGLSAAVFPWSSPYAMLARAAQEPALWPHGLAILWQVLWVALTVRLVARWFRVGVLKSGRPGGPARLFRRNRTRAASVSRDEGERR